METNINKKTSPSASRRCVRFIHSRQKDTEISLSHNDKCRQGEASEPSSKNPSAVEKSSFCFSVNAGDFHIGFSASCESGYLTQLRLAPQCLEEKKPAEPFTCRKDKADRSDSDCDKTKSNADSEAIEENALPAEVQKIRDALKIQLTEYFLGKRRTFSIPVKLCGTEFQLSIWEKLLEIPYGSVKTYSEMASLAGSPKGARAAGSACNKNPVIILVPCHRVVGAKGQLTGYAGGLKLKEHLLALEKENL